MGIFNICLDRMKVVALLLFAAAAAAALGTYTTSADALAKESDILVAELCPRADDPDTCVKDLPGLWAAMAPYIFPEHYKHICEDMECPDKKAHIPGCEECSVRINDITDYLAHDDVIEMTVQGFANSDFCQRIAPDKVEECKEAVTKMVTAGLPILVAADRAWVETFCQEWGCAA